MSEVSETEIKSMTKEQNYMRGYEDGKSDALDKIRAEIESIDTVKVKLDDYMNIIKSPQRIKDEVLEIIDKYSGVSE